jgi:quercetin dioxygenase-like cupin family protein
MPDLTNPKPFSGPDWTEAIMAELKSHGDNGRVGSRLVSETAVLRVWHLSLAPGERLAFHRHVNDYFWTVLTAGAAKSRHGDGTVRAVSYAPGDTRHFAFGVGESMVHDLENIGETTLVFVTVEMLGGPNPALALS